MQLLKLRVWLNLSTLLNLATVFRGGPARLGLSPAFRRGGGAAAALGGGFGAELAAAAAPPKPPRQRARARVVWFLCARG